MGDSPASIADRLAKAESKLLSLYSQLNWNPTTGLIDLPAGTVGGSSGGGILAVDVYTTPGTDTWTKNADAVVVAFIAVGAGGGGGGGAGQTAGTAKLGGGGGAGGGHSHTWADATALPSTLSVVVGAGGTGGAGGTNANGSDGTAGGDSYVEGTSTWDRFVHAGGGGLGAGGTSSGQAAANVGNANLAMFNGGQGGIGASTAVAGFDGTDGFGGAGGGGGGGGVTSGGTLRAAGGGGGAVGIVGSLTPPTNTSTNRAGRPGPGGDGGAGSASTTGTNGEDGIDSGGGGGGGGPGTNIGGDGGDGGDGCIIIIQYGSGGASGLTHRMIESAGHPEGLFTAGSGGPGLTPSTTYTAVWWTDEEITIVCTGSFSATAGVLDVVSGSPSSSADIYFDPLNADWAGIGFSVNPFDGWRPTTALRQVGCLGADDRLWLGETVNTAATRIRLFADISGNIQPWQRNTFGSGVAFSMQATFVKAPNYNFPSAGGTYSGVMSSTTSTDPYEYEGSY